MLDDIDVFPNDLLEEAEFWSWVVDLKEDLKEQLIIYVDLVNKWKGATGLEAAVTDIGVESLTELTASGSYYPSKSVIARFIATIEDSEIAAYTLIAFHGSNDKKLDGLLRANLFRKGLRKELTAEKQAFRDLRRDMIAELRSNLDEVVADKTTLSKKIAELGQIFITVESKSERIDKEFNKKFDGELQNTIDRLQAKVDSHAHNMGKAISQSETALEDHATKSTNEIENFVGAFKAEMALKAPVSFWEENRLSHRKSSRSFALAIMIATPFVFGGITFAGWEVLSSTEVIWGRYGALIFATSLGVWLVRILVRMYLSHTHLEISAREKIVMTKTYLALLAEGAASNAEERQLVLASIFSSSPTGIVTNDGAPPTAVDLISRFGKK